MSRRTAALAALGVVVLGLGVWRLSPTREQPAPAPSPLPSPSSAARLGEADDEAAAGTAVLRLRFVDAAGAPIPAATVRLLIPHTHNALTEECPICQTPLLGCSEPATFLEVVAALRAGRGGVRELGVQVTDAQGSVEFGGLSAAAAALRVELVHPTRGRRTFPVDVPEEGGAPATLIFGGELRAVYQVLDEAEQPVANAAITLVDVQSFAIAQLRSDGAGEFSVTAPGGDGEERDTAPVRALVQAPGMKPGLFDLDADPQAHRAVSLSRARSLTVLTRAAGKPVEASVTFTPYQGHPRVVATRGGEARFSDSDGSARALLAVAGAQVARLEPVEVPQDGSPVELELRASARLLLTVLDTQGAPLGGAQVSLYGASGTSNDAVTAPDTGLAAVGELPEGDYTLSVQHEGLLSLERPLDLGPGDTALELTLDEGLALSGVVVDAQGKPVEDARVSVEDDETVVPTDRTGPDGRFTLHVPRPGPFLIGCSDDDRGLASVRAEAPKRDLVLRLDPQGSLRVEVKKAPPGVELSVSARGGSDPLRRLASATQEGPGTWLLKGLSSGEWEVSAQADELLPAIANVTLGDHEHRQITLELLPAWFLSGRVLTPEGAPVEGMLLSEPGGAAASVEAGDFRLGPLPHLESVTVELHSNTHAMDPQTFRPTTAQVTLRARPFPMVRGRVVNLRGEPLRSFSVMGTAFEDPQGRFEVAVQRDEGTVRLMLAAPGYVSRVETFPAAEDVGELVLRPLEKVSGRVLGPSGSPVSAATVTCSACSTSALSGSDGHFTVELEREEGDHQPVSFDARRSAQTGHLEWDPKSPLEIRLVPGVKVTGQVLGPDGKGRKDLVLVGPEELAPAFEQRRVDTAADGTFQLDLPEGRVSFEARSAGAAVLTLIAPPSTHVVLGARPGSCGVRIRGDPELVWLMPQQPGQRAEDAVFETNARPGTITLSARGGQSVLEASGIPCGRYKIFYVNHDQSEGEVVELRGGVTEIEALPPSADPDESGDGGL